jgi:hypothetical protein
VRRCGARSDRCAVPRAGRESSSSRSSSCAKAHGAHFQTRRYFPGALGTTCSRALSRSVSTSTTGRTERISYKLVGLLIHCRCPRPVCRSCSARSPESSAGFGFSIPLRIHFARSRRMRREHHPVRSGDGRVEPPLADVLVTTAQDALSATERRQRSLREPPALRQNIQHRLGECRCRAHMARSLKGDAVAGDHHEPHERLVPGERRFGNS